MPLKFRDDTHTGDGIINQIEYHTLGTGKITGTAAKLAYFTTLINNWLNIYGQWGQDASGEWNFDDYNHGNLPREVYDFTDDQEDYALDSDIKGIRQVKIRDAVTEKYSILDYLPFKDRPDNLFGETKGTPVGWFMDGRSIVFSPPPDITLFDKYELIYDREMHQFVVGDTTAEPDMPYMLRPLLIWGPIRDWALANNKDGSKRDLIGLCNLKIGDLDMNPTGLYMTALRYFNKRNKQAQPMIARKAVKGGSWK